MNANSNWTEMLSVMIAFVALVVSALSLSNSYRALHIARTQEERKKPLLVVELLNSHVDFRSEEGVRTYAFELSLRNPSDSDNSVGGAELRITYATSTNARLTVQLPASFTRGIAFSGVSNFRFLSTPLRLDAHQTLRGWFVFRVPNEVLGEGRIEEYSVVLIDSHGIETAVQAIMVREYRDETLSAPHEN
jgi:hypothetical protein